ncbi:MAG: HAD family hydrolase [Gemmatimonadota bacterium]
MGERPFDVITFDCYGTLVDWGAGIGSAFIEAARADGVLLERGPVLEAYMEVEPAVEAEAYRSYRQVLAETARRVVVRLGWRLRPERASFLAESLPGWPVFPDTNPGLERLAAAGYRLGILSNVDEDLLDATRRSLPVAFDPDLIVTAQSVGSYKPARGHFEEARGRIGLSRWLHAAQSWFHDVVPALELAIPVAWVNRKGEARPEGDGRPDFEVATLSALAGRLT